MVYYLFLAAAIIAEMVATSFLKASDGLIKWLPSVVSMLFYFICHIAFGKAITHIHLGVSYAIWCGVGIVGTTLISVLIFREKLSATGIIGIACIMVGCMLLNLNDKI